MRQINSIKKGPACRQAGMSIIEAIVALLILSITGSAIVLLLAQITSLNNSAKIKNQATSYVDQTMELIRSYSQKNGWISLASKGSSSGICYSDGSLQTTTTCIPSGSAPTTCSGNGDLIPSPLYQASYVRSVKITSNGDQIGVTGTVCWLDKNAWFKSESNTFYYAY